MRELVEGDLKVSLPNGVVGRKFDDQTHGLSHCMKAVDFIVESPKEILFIEIKDIDSPSVKDDNRDKYIEKLKNGNINGGLTTKCRDTFLYEWAHERTNKPIYYYVIVGASCFDGAELMRLTESLKRSLPMNGPCNAPWKRSFVSGCAVMNIKMWNKKLPSFPIERISSAQNG